MTQEVAIVQSGERVYSAAVSGLVIAATATDVFTITGADGILVKIKRIRIGGVATAAAAVIAGLVKRVAVNTGGTSTVPVGVLRNGPYPPGTAIAAAAALAAYTVNPAGLGAVTAPRGGTLLVATVGLGAAGAAPVADTVLDFEAIFAPIELRSSADVLAVNFNGAATPAGEALQVSIEWTER